jgi:hypothetical protein
LHRFESSADSTECRNHALHAGRSGGCERRRRLSAPGNGLQALLPNKHGFALAADRYVRSTASEDTVEVSLRL